MAEHRSSKMVVDGSQGTQGCSDMGRNKPKSENTRRGWSFREEKILLASLKDIIAQGWKSENGFRGGYLFKLEDALKREFPNTDIKATPHITSKITIWKKSYYSLQGILSRSGIGFNLNGDHRIEYYYNSMDLLYLFFIPQVDGNARSMRNKSWPYWEDWKEIFGHDRANGLNSEDILESINGLDGHDNIGNMRVDGDYHVNLEDILANENAQDTIPNNAAEDTQEKRDNPPPKRSTKKRKVGDAMDGFVDLFTKMHEDNNSRMDVLSNRIGYEVDLSKARNELYERLGHIPGLTIHDKLDICDALIKERDRLDFFMGSSDDARDIYVMRILSEK
ncbi:hypothetical protein AAHA92_24590 [Salvia divinorum]|uniref:Myb/SANT-like domain-containing protein n=1 Tax=Salvia divinorum TaxID=28513 RepID=A0ABD1GAH5_SALDI